ncbi:MAG: ATP-binding cassette domain-containing protein [Chloroflexi bacterium]|nr:ATP-binding cassette domain-containing protein [Chloroflexota bacterium]
MVIRVDNLVKRYGDFLAVDHLSFEVHRGEIFGLLGPNGAGKTTVIRIIMDILQPDEGNATVLGLPVGQASDRVGYLPEERGLYRNLKLLDTLVYLAELKGVDRQTSRTRALQLLEEMGLQDWADRKVRDLSRGMHQRLQYTASIIHNPEIVFLDEPFQGQDPINVERMKGVIARLREDGKTIVLSTHQMNLVEALCDRILLISQGRTVLYGALSEIKEEFASNTVRIRVADLPSDLPGVIKVVPDSGAFSLTLAEGSGPQEILRALVDRGVEVRAFEVAPVPLEDIFVTVVDTERDSKE